MPSDGEHHGDAGFTNRQQTVAVGFAIIKG
jgi:hypothetical protein